MAPTGRRIRRTISTRSSNKSANPPSSTVLMKKKKKKISSSNDTEGFGENVTMENISSTYNATTNSEVLNNGCSTPKGKKFRIPRINKCPPAPMKRRSSSINVSSSSCTSLKRSPISFFSPPDLELFFFFASDHLCVNDNTDTV